MINFELVDTNPSGTVIKVVGVGGAGGNAIAHMIRSNVQGVEFISANTDAQALVTSQAPVQIRLGRTGLGAGAKPEQGRAAAETAREEIRAALNGAHMVFITAGMGGGTGTGAAPVVAEVAKELGILTVGVVTKPFGFEGARRLKSAEEGIRELSRHVNSLIVVLNENLYDLMDEDATQDDCFRAADDVLHNACAGIAEIINVEGNVNVDFEDVKTIMGEQGQAMMGTAVASGPDRARVAAEQAIACPLLEGVDLHGARGVLVNITASRSLKMRETREIMEIIRGYAAEDATVIFGNAYDETMGDDLRVTVVATGLGKQAQSGPQLVPEPAEALRTGTDDYFIGGANMPMGGYGNDLQVPTVMRNPRGQATAQVRAMESAGMEHLDIPAFLRKQAD
ncbi:cell division protein FtsZ [Kerstersia gyiorum]|jgi:cell division protein FtsZ|uniref:Cell division protein FtsZ n=1 Tax=Kerstersia gyiorum TaxID=206506 RepID=A0A171KP67_9BURK|nr:cell division protein FtsZ [Kerstersia gyiorum]AZV92666.1 cell division protein FtsZ [Bordetella sp. J329]MCO7637862.1 cell division protein FtsZ [Pseudomonas sp. S 311-6]KAB0542335.1 cell division protein FtsZ [Kerstersia gyiorum]KKO70684.1 cell division protein FtsZ [Kerstersia gyiorum]MCH4270911.1 cell division protein FtsZ [Kerstersia gyiorum]